MIYNFRFDRPNIREILWRIENDKQLSQGWGGGQEVNLDLCNDEFVTRTFDYYSSSLKTTKIPSNLTRMRQFRDGDMVVVPHLPEYGTVSVHVVDGDFPSCYSYDVSDDTHQNHRITLKDSFGLGSEISIYNEKLLAWYGKLKSLRLPVLPIPEFGEIFSDVVTAMRVEGACRYDPSELDDFLNRVSQVVRGVVTQELLGMPSSGWCNFVRRLVRATSEAKLLAEGNGIVLLDRHEICGLLMPLLSQRMAER